jgi:ubiquinone/menaquinone biosynthesis C-methylase UbiE
MGIKEAIEQQVSYDSALATPLNQALRYLPIVEFLKKLRKKNKNLRVLEVGSGNAGITKFIKIPVTGMDVAFDDKPSPYLKRVRHSALRKFPFKDNCFDVVLSVDTYEHLPKGKREKMLEEMYRVSRRHIVLTTIFGLNKWHRKVLESWDKKSRHYQDILEHKRMGFPETKEVESFLKRKRCIFRKVRGTRPALAYFLNLAEQNIFGKVLSRTLLKALLPVFRHCNSSERLYYFIIKRKRGQGEK